MYKPYPTLGRSYKSTTNESINTNTAFPVVHFATLQWVIVGSRSALSNKSDTESISTVNVAHCLWITFCKQTRQLQSKAKISFSIPRSSALPFAYIGPPLSAVKTTSRSSHMPFAFRAAVTFPTAASAKFTWTCGIQMHPQGLIDSYFCLQTICEHMHFHKYLTRIFTVHK